jgi:negative regulator of sigma E activity
MRRIAQLVLAAGAVAALLVGLRKLFEGRPELLRSAAEPGEAGPQASASMAPPVDETRNGTASLTREELYEKAKRLDIEGRSKMNKRELERALAEREAGG